MSFYWSLFLNLSSLVDGNLVIESRVSDKAGNNAVISRYNNLVKGDYYEKSKKLYLEQIIAMYKETK